MDTDNSVVKTQGGAGLDGWGQKEGKRGTSVILSTITREKEKERIIINSWRSQKAYHKNTRYQPKLIYKFNMNLSKNANKE